MSSLQSGKKKDKRFWSLYVDRFLPRLFSCFLVCFFVCFTDCFCPLISLSLTPMNMLRSRSMFQC